MAILFKKSSDNLSCFVLASALALAVIIFSPKMIMSQDEKNVPPEKPVKIIFIHHSCGENWLADNNGGLGKALCRNNYFPSDTNYGWGPDSIGDSTDITDWPKWFTGPRSRVYLRALYHENGRNATYTRSLSDPGGENTIVMFKSCFPNSNLKGRPGDPPGTGGGLSVGNAKAVYNRLLGYFSTRPDKLFIAVTAPPVTDSTYASNARAFNKWLVLEWLSGYEGNNVAVFDFYNVLTGPENHHRFRNGSIQYETGRGGDTLYYPSSGGDNHPSPDGNRKATREFISLLNIYYQEWIKSAPPPLSTPKPARRSKPLNEPKGRVSEDGRQASIKEVKGDVIDDFDHGVGDWKSFMDGQKKTSLTFERDANRGRGGTASLNITYDVAKESWANCSLVYDEPKNWKMKRGLSVCLHAEKSGGTVVIIAYQGKSPNPLKLFEYKVVLDETAVEGWKKVDIPWRRFRQPSWQGDENVPFNPGSAMGMAFGFEGEGNGRNTGKIWVDDVFFLKKAE